MSLLISLCFAFLAIPFCAQDAVADDRPSGEMTNPGIEEAAKTVDFETQLSKARELRNSLLTKIHQIEKLQPEWNSSPLKAALADSIKGFELSTGCYEAVISVLRLSCQTPLLDLELFSTAEKLFHEIALYYRGKNILFVRTGQDSSYCLHGVERENQLLEKFLSDTMDKETDAGIKNKIEQIHRLRDLLGLAAREFRIGDTEKAASYYWSLLKASEDLGDFAITARVLKCYQCFFYGMYYRHKQELYRARKEYVFDELDCVYGDGALESALANVADQKIAEELRGAHAEVIRLRRSGDNLATEKAYKRLIELARHSGANAPSLYYFALNAHHSYLEHCFSKKKHYDFLRRQLISAWIAEEIDKQKSLSETNTKYGGDWSKLEDVFKKLQAHSVFVHRSIALETRWGVSTNNAIFFMPIKYRSQRVVEYGNDSVRGNQLWLTCRTKIHSPVSPLIYLLVDTLKEGGFKVTPSAHCDGTVVVYGDWSPKKSDGRESK